MPSAGKILISVLVFGFVICFLAESVSGRGYGHRSRRQANHTIEDFFGRRSDVPEFCNGKACPNYTLVDEHEDPDYEVRLYKETLWLAIKKETNCSKKEGLMDMIKYVMGDNSENRTLSVGVPALKKVIPDQKKNILLFFMIEPNPPEPNDPDMSIVNCPAQEFYVIAFDDHAKKGVMEENKNKLIDAVGEDNIDQSCYFVACYNFPHDEENSYAEIWMKVQNNSA